MKQRSAFGKTLAEFNGLQGMIADIATDVEVARLLTLRAALAEGRRASRPCTPPPWPRCSPPRRR